MDTKPPGINGGIHIKNDRATAGMAVHPITNVKQILPPVEIAAKEMFVAVFRPPSSFVKVGELVGVNG